MEKRYYSISEVADMFKVNQSHLRFLERQFPQLSPKRSAKGIRFYTKDDIQVIRQIFFLVNEQGMTQSSARNSAVNTNPQWRSPTAYVLAAIRLSLHSGSIMYFIDV